jgi:tripeptidyl-peptidase-2
LYSYNSKLLIIGNNCRACIDTSEKGDLDSGVFLGEYTHSNDFAPLTQEDQLNVSINVHDDGNTLEIVSLCCK